MSSFQLNRERMTKVETIAERKSFSLSVVSSFFFTAIMIVVMYRIDQGATEYQNVTP